MTIDNLIRKKQGEASVITWIKRRITRNQNVLSLTVGPTGSGKSLNDIGKAIKIDPNFNVEKQVVFKLSELMNVINSDWFKALEWKIVIYEEAQISLSNRAWQSTMNKMLNYLLSTFRHQNIILFFNAPYRDFLDSQSMKLVHIIFDMRGIDRKKQVSKVRPLLQQYNSKLKKTYEHSIRTILPNGQIKPLNIWEVKKPPQEACDIYEAKKKRFTDELNKQIMKQALKLEKGDEVKDERKPLTSRQQETLDLMEKHGNVKEVAQIMGIALKNVYKHLEYARNKGYTPQKAGFTQNNSN